MYMASQSALRASGDHFTECESSTTLKVNREDCTYTPFYCEENIWKLCETIQSINTGALQCCHVIFISNEKEMVPLWAQKAGSQGSSGLVTWDYHVILAYSLLNETMTRSKIYDFDSRRPFPSNFHDYFHDTFRPNLQLEPDYHRMFRVIGAPSYLKLFSSNRFHMKKVDGTWCADPPSYSCILNEAGSDTLKSFISMKESRMYGEIFSQDALFKRFTTPS
ncbi:Protein N-terminal glutamine amidohydrolase [Nymphon striatum]|nr:Protein N-terminal glutamine amidohydrolase [Nymphon striatum]